MNIAVLDNSQSRDPYTPGEKILNIVDIYVKKIKDLLRNSKDFFIEDGNIIYCIGPFAGLISGIISGDIGVAGGFTTTGTLATGVPFYVIQRQVR